MIKIDKINKYFNKNKKNQIHVINNISFELENVGLISILGPSGCGKTTLLNCISGLDKINSGNIYIDGEKITNIRNAKIDKIRNINIGYIFQNYNLIEDMTVYDNVAFSLKLIGLKNENEIKKRVEYVLKELDIYKYRNRLASMLSGGEKQKVSIARAIVKNPNIIIADEPTGNLDRKNTIEIMNIIKTISKTKLVILVTHEKELAYFYSTRIIQLEDGKIISNELNDNESDLDYKIENEIYLNDFKNHYIIEQQNINIDLYKNIDDALDIKIIIKNNNIYIKSNKKEKLEIIDENSQINLIESEYKTISKKEYKYNDYNNINIINNDFKIKYSSIYNFKTMIKNGFNKVKQYSILKKIATFGLFISSMFILYSVSNIFGVLNVDEKMFVKENKNYLSLYKDKITVEEYLNYEKNENINYIIPGKSNVKFDVIYNNFLQTKNAYDYIEGSLSSIKMINNNNMIYGRMPENKKEIVVDKLVINKMFNRQISKQVGILKIEDTINLEINAKNIGKLKIVGIVDLESPSIYVDESMLINLYSSNKYISDYLYNDLLIYDKDLTETEFIDYTLFNLNLTNGKYPINDYEVIVNENMKEVYPLNKEINIKVNNNKLLVVGYYKSDNIKKILTNNNTIKYSLIEKTNVLTISSNNKKELISYFKNQGIQIQDVFEKDKNEFIEKNKQTMISSLIIAMILLLISIIEIYLIIRTSFLSKIKEIGIYRAIGVKKIDIYKMFLGEIVILLMTRCLPGYLLMYYILYTITKINYLNNSFLLNFKVISISAFLIFVFNVIVGLIPIYNLIRKKPAEILSRTDID